MRIPLDPAALVPVYRQIEAWLRGAIADGSLPEGARLPASRTLAADLGVSRVTVSSAYAALESDGLVTSRVGSGTYVAEALALRGTRQRRDGGPARLAWPAWQARIERHAAESTRTAPGPAAPSSGDLLSFTGVGDLRQFDVSGLSAALRDAVRLDGHAALGYGSLDSGLPRLRRTVARLLASQGLHVDPDDVLVTSGSQQGLALVCQAVARPGDTVLVELPTYDRALDLFASAGLRVVGVPTDDRGMVVEALEPLLRQHQPRLVYTVPNFANPTGACLSAERRRRLLTLVGEYAVALVEDDFAGDLRFEGRALPAVKALDPGGFVVYLGTFSKLLVPGLRLGYLVAEGPVRDRVEQLKRAHDLTTSPLVQHAVDRFVSVGRYQTHLRRSVRLGRQRLDALMAALATHLPQAGTTRPDGGLFAWVRLDGLPDGTTTRSLLTTALAHGVAFTPGDRFFVDPTDGARHLRLNFMVLTPAEIDEAVRRLARALDDPSASGGTAPTR